MRMQYPRVLFRSDYASGLGLSIYQAKKHRSLQSGRAWPDLFIYEPRVVKGVQYAGLALELKKEGTPLIIKIGPRKGHLTQDPHIREQVLLAKELKARGYYATIAVGFEQAIRVIDWYFGRNPDGQDDLPF